MDEIKKTWGELDRLSIDLSKEILSKNELTYLDNFLVHSLNVIAPADKLILFGVQNDNSLSVMNGLRTLLENWANLAYIISKPQKTESYAEAIENSALAYKKAFDELRSDPSKGIAILSSVQKWTGKGPTARVKLLGEGPEFQYEFLSRYTHSDVWSVVNDYSVNDKEKFTLLLLGWAVEFINHTLYNVASLYQFPEELKDRIITSSDRAQSQNDS